MSHQLVLITSLPFVHTARRSYRLSNPVNYSDRALVGNNLCLGKSFEPYCLEEGEVVTRFPQVNLRKDHSHDSIQLCLRIILVWLFKGLAIDTGPTAGELPPSAHEPIAVATPLMAHSQVQILQDIRGNDPSAGSPTETLLRLLLPLSDKVHQTFQK